MKRKDTDYRDVTGAIEAGRYRLALKQLENIEGDQSLRKLSLQSLMLRLVAYNRLQWLPEAKQLVQYVLDKAGAVSDVHLEVALFYMLLGESTTAEKHFRIALSSTPNSMLIATELAILFEQRGDTERALKIYNKVIARAIKINTIDSVFTRALARATGLRKLSVAEEQAIRKFIETENDSSLSTHMYFSMAKHYARNHENKKQIELLSVANRLAYYEDLEALGEYSVDEARGQLAALKNMFAKPRPDWMPEYESSSNSYIFVLGMPRSGTTLLEQILGAHSRVGNSGESRAMHIALSRFSPGSHEGIALNSKLFEHYKHMSSDNFLEVIKYYERYQALLSDAEFVTDKELNCVNRVGLIANMFPKAKFISIKRHPLDVATSLLQHYFKNAAYSTDALNCVLEYEAYYAKVDFWKELFPGKFVDVEYEELVSDPATITSLILQGLGLEWEDSVMRFNERKNSVRTPSLSQVRQGFNDAAVNKWKSFSGLLTSALDYLGVD